MDFDFSEEQRLLRDSVDRLLADHYAFDKRRGYLAEPDGWSRTMWSQYAELGLLGLPFAEEHGGFGGGGIDVMLVMEAFGRALVLDLIAIAHGQGVRRVEVTANQHALAFYETTGFAVDHEVKTMFGPAPRMHMDIPPMGGGA